MIRGLVVQLQVIHALILREIKSRFGEHRLGYIWALLQPVMMIGIFATMFHFLGRSPIAGMAILPFLVSGFGTFYAYSSTMARTVSAIDANRALLFYPRVRPADLLFGRFILEFATYTCVMTILLLGAIYIEGDTLTPDVLQIALALLLACTLGGGLGSVLCGLSVFFPALQRLYGPLLRPMFWASGLFYSVNNLPSHARHIVLYNPVLHCVEYCRAGIYPGYHPYGIEPTYPALWALALWFVGLTLERVARRHVDMT